MTHKIHVAQLREDLAIATTDNDVQCAATKKTSKHLQRIHSRIPIVHSARVLMVCRNRAKVSQYIRKKENKNSGSAITTHVFTEVHIWRQCAIALFVRNSIVSQMRMRESE